ncbi:MAG: tyrosine-type recombinase/integrase [Dehalococcoidales bacterium]
MEKTWRQWPQDESLWPSLSHHSKGITSGTFYSNLQRYFKKAGISPSGVHIFRHTAAKLRRDAGETVEDVSRFLDHSSLAVTTVYLRRLEGEQDKAGQRWLRRLECRFLVAQTTKPSHFPSIILTQEL